MRPTPRPIRVPINDFPEVNALLNDPTLSGLYLFEPNTKLIDSSGNEVHGTITGALYQDNSLLFSSDDVSLGDNHDLTDKDTKLTVFALAKTPDTGTDMFLADKVGGGAGWRLSRDTNDKCEFTIYGNSVKSALVSSPTTTQNRWHTFAGTYSGNGSRTGMTPYLDKVGASAGATTIANVTANATACTLGTAVGGATNDWDGHIALVAIWIGKELNQSEIDSMHDFAMGLI